MIILGKYDEIWSGQGYPKMRDSFEKNRYENQERIIEYLKRGHVHMVTASPVKDYFTGEYTNIEKIFLDDGEYSWCSSLIYYVDKYNLVLPKDFIDHVIKKTA